MPPVNKPDNTRSIRHVIQTVALTALAAQGAGADQASSQAPTDGTGFARALRFDTARRVAAHLAPGNATLSDLAASLGDWTSATKRTAQGGLIAATVQNGGYHAHTAANMSAAALSRPFLPAAAPAPVSVGRKLLVPAIISSKMYGCPASDYSAPSTVGGQSMWALLDTGSSTYGVASKSCDDCNGIDNGYVAGSSAVVSKTTLDAQYGKGGWQGALVQDAVSLVGGPSARIAFGDILEQDEFFNSNNCIIGQTQPVNNQAIMGLGGTPLLLEGTTSYFDAVKNSLHYPGYSFGMCDINGMFFLGGYPTNYLSGDMITTPMVDASHYLSVAMTGLSVGAVDIGVSYEDLGATIVDTGTSVIMLPPDAYAAATKSIVAQSGGAVNQTFFDQGLCIPDDNVSARLPSMTFKFYDPQYPDGSTVYTFGKSANASYVDVVYDAQKNAHVCAMLVNTEDSPQSLLGASMMRGALVYFDRQANSVGFGVSTGICS